jgi:hypothetical protein
MTVPNEIKQFVSNARYYLEAANKFPPPTKDAAHILLLITSWENIVIADKQLHAWASGGQVDPKLLRDHEAKLDEISKDSYVQRIIVGPAGKGIPAQEIKYATGKELKELRELCQYGSSSETHEVSKLFARHWFSDDFRRGLVNKIEWTEMSIDIYEKL